MPHTLRLVTSAPCIEALLRPLGVRARRVPGVGYDLHFASAEDMGDARDVIGRLADLLRDQLGAEVAVGGAP
jgi:hypothetical protein